MSSFNGLRLTTALGPPPGADDAEITDEPSTEDARAKTRHPSLSLSLDLAAAAAEPSSDVVPRRGSLAVPNPTPTAASAVATTPSHATGKTPSNLLEKLVAAKVQPGEDPVRAMQDQLDSEKDAAATLKTDCLAILNLRPEIRTDSQRNQLLKWMQSQNSFLLKELSRSILIKLCEKVTLVSFKPGTIVFRQGSPSESFFIIVTGGVSIWINPPKKDARADEDGEVLNSGTDLSAYAEDDTAKASSASEAAESDQANVEALPFASPNDDAVDPKQKYRRPTGPGVSGSAICVGSMAAGEEKSAFGELGLVSGEPRSATIKCEEYTELLRVSKIDFHTVLKTYSEALQRKVRLIASFPGFKSLPPKPYAGSGRGRMKQRFSAPTQVSEKYISKLSLFFREKTVAARSIVLHQGQKCEHIYFLVDGEVELLQSVDHELRPGVTKRVEVVVARIAAALPDDLQTSTAVDPSTVPEEPADAETSTVSALEAVKEVTSTLPALVAPVVAAASQPHAPVRSGVSQPGQICGEAPLFLKHLRQCYDGTLRTTTRSQFLVISKHDFLRRINLILLSRFSTRLKEKVKWREKRIQQMKLPKGALRVNGGSQTERSSSSSSSGSTFSKHVTSLALNSWTQRQKSMHLASSKNLRLLPELTSSAHTHSQTVGLTAYEEAAFRAAKSTGRSQAHAAQQRLEMLQEQERDREWKRTKAAKKPPHMVPPMDVPAVEPLEMDIAFSQAGQSPLSSASRTLIVNVNPTMGLSRRGSMGQMPDLRPTVSLAAVQIHSDASASEEKVLMPHSLPMSLPVSSSCAASLSDALDVPNRSLGASNSPTRDRSRSPSGRISRDRSRSPSRLSVSPTPGGLPATGRVALTPEQHLVLSTQLRSTDAHTRAKQIVKVMQQMKSASEDWVITSKAHQPGEDDPPPVEFPPVPVDNAREMWQRREMRRDREILTLEDAPSTLAWEQLNPRLKTKETTSTTKSTGKMFDPAADVAALIAASSSSKRAERMERATVGKRNHKVRVTSTLLRDLSVIAPKSTILQEALATGRSRETQTHRMGGRIGTSSAQQLLKHIDWSLLMASSHGAANPLVDIPQFSTVHHVTAIRPQNSTGSITYKEVLDQKEMTSDAIEEQLTALQQRANSGSPTSFPLLRPVPSSFSALPPELSAPAEPSFTASSLASPRTQRRRELAALPGTERDARRQAHAEWLEQLHRAERGVPPNENAPQPLKRRQKGPRLDADNELIAAASTLLQRSMNGPKKKRKPKAAVQEAPAPHGGELPLPPRPKLYEDPEPGGLFSLTHAAPRNDRSKKSGYQATVRYR
jgi:CRP-like cAMP-binding protein